MGAVEDAYPLASAQAAMLLHGRADPRHYQDALTLHLEARLDGGALREAFAGLCARHEVLRTSFAFDGYSEPLQLVHRAVPVPVEVEDLRALAPERQAELRRAWVDRVRGRVMDAASAPLLRAKAHRCDERGFHLSLVVHHAVLDGWSLATALTELLERYSEGLLGAARPRPGLDVRYRDFVALERAAVSSAEHQRFWDGVVGGGTPLRLRPPAPAGGRPGGGTQVHRVDLPGDLVEGLRVYARREQVPLKSVLLAAHARVVEAAGDVAEPLTGLLVNGRPETLGGDEVLGVFVNTVPVRLGTGGSWRTLTRAALDTERELLAFRRYPIAELARRHGRGVVPDVLLNVADFRVYRRLRDVDGVRVLGSERWEESELPLVVSFRAGAPPDPRLSLSLHHSTPDVSRAQAGALGERYLAALEALAADPDGDVRGLVGEPVLACWQASVEPVRERAPVPAGAAAAATPTEASLASIWRDLLGSDDVRADDSFFDAGGHSLQVLPLLGRIRDRFGVEPDIARVLEARTLRELAGELDAQLGRAGARGAGARR